MLLMKIAIKPNKIELEIHTTKVYPELEDLEVTPGKEEQNFKSSKYGYDNVKVKAIKGKGHSHSYYIKGHKIK